MDLRVELLPGRVVKLDALRLEKRQEIAKDELHAFAPDRHISLTTEDIVGVTLERGRAATTQPSLTAAPACPIRMKITPKAANASELENCSSETTR